MDRSIYGNYYEVLQHELGHAVGFRHTDESPSSGQYTYIYGSYNGTAQTTNVMHSLPIVPVQPVDAEALRLLYPTHDNDYDPSVEQVDFFNNKGRVTVSWVNRDPNRPEHTKIMYTISKSGGKGAAYATQSGYEDNTGEKIFTNLPIDNTYTICIAGSNFREDEVFPGRCLSVQVDLNGDAFPNSRSTGGGGVETSPG